MTVEEAIRPPVAAPAPEVGGEDRRIRGMLDPLVVFQIYLVLLILSPSIYIVEPLGAAGTPATIFGCLIFILWLIGRLTGTRGQLRPTPLHWVLGVFVLAMLLGFCAGMLRPISGLEVSSSLRGLIALVSGVGVMLFAADSLRSKGMVDALLRSAVLGGTILAAMGVVQFVTGINFVEVFHLPGLTANSELSGLYQRSGFPRISATAIHSIEFSAVIGLVLPAAAHLALHATRKQWWRWLQFGVMAVALPLTVARSGTVALIIGLVFVIAVASRRQRFALVIVLPIVLAGFAVATPGLLGTIRNLFTGAGEDISISGRTDDLQAVFSFIQQSPWFGRGFSTFVPTIYRTLDNQFYATAVENGLIGLLALILLFLVPIVACAIAAYSTRHRFLRSQALSVAAGILSAMVLSFTFDFFGFSMAFGMLCLMLGVSGAIWRIHRSELVGAASAPRRRARLSVSGGVLVGFVIVGTLVAGGLAVRNAQSVYEARGSVLLLVPQASDENVYDATTDLPGVSNVMQYLMESDQVRGDLTAKGVGEYTMAIGSGSLAPYTDLVGSGNILWIAARGDTPEQALAGVTTVRSEFQAQLTALQAGKGIPPAAKVIVDHAYADPEVFEVGVNRPAAVPGLVAVSALSGLLVVLMLQESRTSALSKRDGKRLKRKQRVPV
jgi:O-antigen ligase